MCQIPKHIIKYYFSISALIFSALLHAQYTHQFEHIELPIEKQDLGANSILEDSKGLIWFGLSEGLVVYDGYNGKIVLRVLDEDEISEFGRVEALIEDKSGKIWVGTNSGVYVYDPVTGNSKPLKP